MPVLWNADATESVNEILTFEELESSPVSYVTSVRGIEIIDCYVYQALHQFSGLTMGKGEGGFDWHESEFDGEVMREVATLKRNGAQNEIEELLLATMDHLSGGRIAEGWEGMLNLGLDRYWLENHEDDSQDEPGKEYIRSYIQNHLSLILPVYYHETEADDQRQ